MKELLLILSLGLVSSLVSTQSGFDSISEPQATVVNMGSIEPRTFTGGSMRAVVANTVLLSQLELRAGTKTRHHNHADDEVVLLLEGRIRAIGGDETFEMSPGDVFSLPPFVPHQLEALADSVIIEVGRPGPKLDALREP